MQLKTLLVIVVSTLAVLSGVSVFVGSKRHFKGNTFWFLMTTIGIAAWALGCAAIISLPASSLGAVENGVLSLENASLLTRICLIGVYLGAIIMDLSLVCFVSWRLKTGRVVTLLFLVLGAMLAGLFIYDPSLLIQKLLVGGDGNTAVYNPGWYWVAYNVYFILITSVFLGFMLLRILKTKDRREKKGLTVFLISLSLTGVVSLIFDVILPPLRYDLIWVGPTSTAVAVLAFYYAVLKFRLIELKNSSMRALTHIILIVGGTALYMTIFYIIFTALFRGQSPSTAVIVLNFIMILIVLALMPAISELSSSIRSLMTVDTIDLPYVTKKLNEIAGKKVDLKNLAAFLAEHLHYSCVGIIVGGKLYSSDPTHSLARPELVALRALPSPKSGLWQSLDPAKLSPVFEQAGLTAVAELKTPDGRRVAQLLVGTPLSKRKSEKNLADLEMILNLVTAIIK